MSAPDRSRSQDYYDEFSQTYEQHRHHGYHVLIDNLELESTLRYLGDSVLEAGCGTGLILRRLERHTRHAVGIDLSAGMLSVARSRGLSVAQCPVDALPFPDGTFDTVVSFKVLAHVPQIEGALGELCRVTRVGGHLLLEFYNRHSLRGLIKRLKPASRIGSSYSDEDVFTRLDSLEQIRGYLPAGLRLVGVRGVRIFTPFAQLHDVPLMGGLLRELERRGADAPGLRRLGGFLVVILQKDA
jgi:ubiquinone/menaquinone biosynthesis C-methylase UbiE